MIESTTMELGERRNITIEVRSIADKAFDITNASYTLRSGDEIEASGSCDIIRQNATTIWLSAVIQPMRKCAVYTLEYVYDIAPEKLIYVCQIRVV